MPSHDQPYQRREWVRQTLLKVPEGGRVLDAGAGPLRYKEFCTDHLNYVSQDFCQYDGSGDGLGFQTPEWEGLKVDIVSDITSIPEKDESFDAIMCIEVFEHIPDPISALREFVRLLKTGGHLIITAPFCSEPHQTPYYHYSGFSDYFYKYWFEKLNIELKEIDYNGTMFDCTRHSLWVSREYAKDHSREMTTEELITISNAMDVMISLHETETKKSHEIMCYGMGVYGIKK